MDKPEQRIALLAEHLAPSHVVHVMPSASWQIEPAPLSKGSQSSERITVEMDRRPDYGDTVSINLEGHRYTSRMSREVARKVAGALLSAAGWEPEAAFLRKADELLHPPAAAIWLSNTDPEPARGTVVEMQGGQRWVRDSEIGPCSWLIVGQEDGDPESWFKVADSAVRVVGTDG